MQLSSKKDYYVTKSMPQHRHKETTQVIFIFQTLKSMDVTFNLEYQICKPVFLWTVITFGTSHMIYKKCIVIHIILTKTKLRS